MQREVYFASENGDINALQTLHENNPRALWKVSFEGNTALHIAAREGHLALVKWILTCIKSNMSGACNADFNTPLHEAAKGGNTEIVEILLHYNKWPAYRRNQHGEMPLHIACKYGHEDTVRLLLAATPFHLVALIPKKDGQTCLHVAASGRYEGVVRLLLSTPSWCNILHFISLISDAQGATPLHIAVDRGDLNIVQAILGSQLGSQWYMSWLENNLMTKKDKLGRCAVHLAAMKGLMEIINLFMSEKPDCVEISSTDLKTALHFAVERNQLPVVERILSDKTAETAAKLVGDDCELLGNTALHLAAINGVDPQLVERLVSVGGVKLNAVNNQGLTAIDIAAKSQRTEILNILEVAGATQTSIRQCYPLHRNDDVSSLYSSSEGKSKIIRDVDILVASLIATVTFAAIFQVPGGLEEDKKHPRYASAKFALDRVFKLFLLSDSLALYTSLTVVAAWLISERLQKEGSKIPSSFAGFTVLCLGTSIFCTGVCFLVRNRLGHIPRNFEALKNSDKKEYRKYFMLLESQINAAILVPLVPLIYIVVWWIIEYYIKGTSQKRDRLKKELKQVLRYIFSILLLLVPYIIGWSVL